ncbi:MAG TPA: hypothetical protein VIJ38_05940 [Acidobacteriaceae bacterium]
MLSEWTAECSHEAPTLIVPWSENPSAPDTGSRFFDLRTNPYDIAEISEIEHNPTLARALRSLNATRSPFLTAKCDTWTLPGTDHAEALEALRLELMLAEEDALFGFASYIDLLWRERSVFASAHQQQDRLDRIMRRAQRLQHPEAALQCVLRPALLDLSGPLEGFAFTLYITALGPEPEIARRRWELAMEDIVDLLRGKELEPVRGSATIDSTDAYPLRVRHLGQNPSSDK